MGMGQVISVSSFSEMRGYITRMSDRTEEMNEVKEKVVNSLLNLQENISGTDGIKEALDALSLAIKTQSSNVNTCFNEISRFISGQISAYESANEETHADLSLAGSQFDQMNGN